MSDNDKVNTGHHIEDKELIKNARKPVGELGHQILDRMNESHESMASWGVTHFEVNPDSKILDIGCGGGRNAGELLKKYPGAEVTAIDYSEVSVEKATAYNAEAIKGGRCKVQKGDVSNLTLPEENYDLATAFETIYFWPGLEKCFAQVAKVLKPGGVFMIVNESDGTDETSLKFEKIIDGMKCHTVEDIKQALKNAGFSKVKADHHPNKPWITVMAKR
jgi:ubiquinone/menaquinone biosynthesis C-methylase UbiE